MRISYPRGFSFRPPSPPELPPELPPSDDPPSLSSNFSKAKGYICRTSRSSMTIVYQFQILIRYKTDIHPLDILHRTLCRSSYSRTTECHVKRTKLIQFHLVSVSQIFLNLLYKRFNHMFHILPSSSHSFSVCQLNCFAS